MGVLIVWIDQRVGLKFTIDPLRNKSLQFRGIIPLSSVSPLTKLRKQFSKSKVIIDMTKTNHF